MLLALDTSTERASIALYDGELRAEYSWLSRGEQTRELMPAVDHLLSAAALDVSVLTGIVVATGPGSFNGLRVGMTVAKGLALVQNLPIVGVPTLDVVAYQHLFYPHIVHAVVRAGRGRIATAMYSVADGRLQRFGEYRNTTVADLCTQVVPPALVAGEMTPAMAEEMRGLVREGVNITSGAATWHRAGYLAEIGLSRLQKGEPDDLASLQPIYLAQPTMGGAGQVCG